MMNWLINHLLKSNKACKPEILIICIHLIGQPFLILMNIEFKLPICLPTPMNKHYLKTGVVVCLLPYFFSHS